MGSENRRDGTPNITTATGGVSAQKLRHLEILLRGPSPPTWQMFGMRGKETSFPTSTLAGSRISRQ